MINEPLKFEPILKEKIWGGEKLINLLHKKSDKNNIGESWEISDVNQDVSIVSEGKHKGESITSLINKYKSDLVGKKVYEKFANKFPLLIKFIDAKEVLSIQLHPNNELAKKRHNSFGKTEMWYVMQADENANLIIGFKNKVNQKTYKKHLEEKSLLEILNSEIVKKGDAYFIPTGRVHAIGAGVLLAEIQQTSDITYRIYDWDRQDDKGNYRELHTDNALEALDFEVKEDYKIDYDSNRLKTSLVNCSYFTTNILKIDGKINIDYSNKDSFIIYMCVLGSVLLKNTNFEIKLNYGETILIPNSLNKFKIISNQESKLLEIYIK